MTVLGIVLGALSLYGVHCCCQEHDCTALTKSPPWLLLSGIATTPSLLLTWWWRTVHKEEDIAQARRQERSTRFFESVKLLAESAKPEAQLGALYSLEELAKDSPEDLPRVMETLCAFLRQNGVASNETLRSQPAPVQAAFTIVTRIAPNNHELRADLRGAKLSYIEAEGSVPFKRLLLDAADLSNAKLSGVLLRGAHLVGVNFAGGAA